MGQQENADAEIKAGGKSPEGPAVSAGTPSVKANADGKIYESKWGEMSDIKKIIAGV